LILESRRNASHRVVAQANTIVIEQNLNQLRQKHLRDSCALQILARNNIYRGDRLTRYTFAKTLLEISNKLSISIENNNN